MATLKEIKSRIQSVQSTQKITSAMKMVSSAKLRKAQKTIENFFPYEQRLNGLLNNFLSAEEGNVSVFADVREVKRVAIIAFSSNTSLCGSYNSNVIKHLQTAVENNKSLGKENILIFPVGKKIAKACHRLGFEPQDNFEAMADKPTYLAALELADKVMTLFNNKEIDKVELIYHHFKSKSSQVLTEETFLPIQLKPAERGAVALDYIVEPDRATIMSELIPKVLRLKIYTALLDSNASEHAARTIAMQMATDNATDLLQELSLQYNKSRQQAITNELLDIVGGSFGQN
ncbi:ATP synthase F1 subcomplex gamma subunit [Paludibacter propionicigenes WB4]|uniref:ATP synthase gamma chain n=1 Tax=Paludibacter propionicigenes (strain DSM 17365 / JCM 13257 / WB4) TaxID=694427 RepID=E4T785_PALPW|nr:F0F1 ATP synthase subunit gamma [Paludibacter propionicigenes]ADQ80579.1 ATP synthase F1 subcomplex gamma subunit [Paludibacter propionicigenes WB4]